MSIKSITNVGYRFCTSIDVLLWVYKVVTESVNMDAEGSPIVKYSYEIDAAIRAASDEVLASLIPVYRDVANLRVSSPWVGNIISDRTNNDPSARLLGARAGSSAVTEMWTLSFTSATGYTATGYLSGACGSGTTTSDFTSTNGGDLIIPAQTNPGLFTGTFTSGDSIFIAVNTAHRLISDITSYIAAGDVMRTIAYGEGVSIDDNVHFRFTNKGRGLLKALQNPDSMSGARLESLPDDGNVDDIQLGNWDGDVYDQLGIANNDYFADDDISSYDD